METYFWTTSESHFDNDVTMLDYLNRHCDLSLNITMVDGSYAEAIDDDGNSWGLHASGDGDSYHHKVEFKALTPE